MRLIIIVISLFFCKQLEAQDLVALKNHVIELEVDSIKTNLKNKCFSGNCVFSIWYDISRELDFGYEHHRFLVSLDEGDVRVNIFTKNNSIQFGWFSIYNESHGEHLEVEAIENTSILVEQYVNQHNAFYGSNWTILDFQNQMMNDNMIGSGCASGMSYTTPLTEQTWEYIKRKNKKELNQLLISFSPELQYLGAMGLTRIKKSNKQQKEIIKHLKKRNSTIYTCSGCTFGVLESFNKLFSRISKNGFPIKNILRLIGLETRFFR